VIYINMPKMGEEEIDAVVKVMKSNMLTSGLGAGPAVTEFEKGLQMAGTEHAVAMNTAVALHAAQSAVSKR
jgi:dTDP-4-amino-4,6-dideoxygalactose transaminase